MPAPGYIHTNIRMCVCVRVDTTYVQNSLTHSHGDRTCACVYARQFTTAVCLSVCACVLTTHSHRLRVCVSRTHTYTCCLCIYVYTSVFVCMRARVCVHVSRRRSRIHEILPVWHSRLGVSLSPQNEKHKLIHIFIYIYDYCRSYARSRCRMGPAIREIRIRFPKTSWLRRNSRRASRLAFIQVYWSMLTVIEIRCDV